MENATTFTCGLQKLNIYLYIVIILYFSCNIFTFIILNMVTSVNLWKSIKNRLNLIENAKNIKKDKLSVRFSMANISSTFFIVVMYGTYFITYLIFLSRLKDQSPDNHFSFVKYVYVFITAINPIMYLILFKDFRRFVICKL